GRRFGEDQRYGVRVNTVLRDGDMAIDRQEQRLAQLSAAFDARWDGLRLSADLGYLNLHGGPQPYSVDVAPGLPVPRAPDAGRNYNQPWEYVDVDGTVYGMARVEADLSAGLTAYAAAGGRDESMEFLYTSPYLTAANGNFEAAPYALPWKEKALSGEAGLRGHLTTGPVAHQWNLGLTRLDLRRGLRFVAFADFQSNLYDPVDQPKPNLAGVYADPLKTYDANFTSYVVSDTLSVAEERLQLTLGARQQKIDVSNFNQGTGARTSRYTQDKVTPVAGLLFKPRDNLSLYFNYVEGLSQGPVAPNNAENAGEVFEPFVAKQYEAGAKADWGGWATTIGVFQLSQPQGFNQPLPSDPTKFTFTVEGEQRVRGVELQVFGEPRPGLRTLGGLTWMEGEQVKTTGGTFDGKDATGVPALQGNLNLEWDVPALAGFTVWQRTLYTASQYLDRGNAQKLPDWTRLDAGVRHRFTRSEGRDLVLRASVENLLDKDYWVSSARSLTLSSPRTLLVSATFDF
ncbi:MAG TPA: TonB-dependent receptor, partial [Solimonas sp.]